MNPSRDLTPAESRRREAFERSSAALIDRGFTRTDLVFGVVQANGLALVVMLPLIGLLGALFFLANPDSPIFLDPADDIAASLLTLGGLLVPLLVLMVAHEAIHGLVWGLCSPERFKSIEFGVIWKMLTPYCTCSAPLSRWQYVLGSAMPTIVLGILPAAIAIVTGNSFLLCIALLMVLGGGGDALVILKILRFPTKGRTVVYYDHPYECGVVAFTRPRDEGASASA